MNDDDPSGSPDAYEARLAELMAAWVRRAFDVKPELASTGISLGDLPTLRRADVEAARRAFEFLEGVVKAGNFTVSGLSGEGTLSTGARWRDLRILPLSGEGTLTVEGKKNTPDTHFVDTALSDSAGAADQMTVREDGADATATSPEQALDDLQYEMFNYFADWAARQERLRPADIAAILAVIVAIVQIILGR